MDKKELLNYKTKNVNDKINCQQIKQVINSTYFKKEPNNTTILTQQRNKISLNTYSTLEVHGNKVLAEKTILDIRTYICAHGLCQLHNNRSHKRISNYNWNKMLTLSTNINQIISLANNIVSTIAINQQENNPPPNKQKQQTIKDRCVYCNNPKLTGIIHIHFVKAIKEETKTRNIEKNKPIETVFTKIDDIAKENAMKIKTSRETNPPGKRIELNNCHRMSYGDINYLGNNKALLYFHRGIRGTQTFTNSMHPLQCQPKHKDLIVVDDIVFTATCQCDSVRQHREMFPHYRVTCAVGLTCPAKLNNFEREIYKRSRNASTEMFTTARAMLSRYWR